MTDPDGTLTTDYDLFDRQTRLTYVDGTFDAFTYDRLHLATRRDRAGRLTRYYYDAVGRLLGTRDPLGRTVSQEWCVWGSLEALVDAAGNRTSWERDLQGRVTRELRADGATETTSTYEPRSGRLRSVTAPKEQVTTYTYAADDQLLSMTFTNAAIPTPGVTYTYDTRYPRMSTMVDGTGTTAYAYQPAGQPGAGQVAQHRRLAVERHDRVHVRRVGSGDDPRHQWERERGDWAFDALGRITAETNVLGTFTYTYVGVTPRVSMVTYPNGQQSTYTYYGTAGDHRLETIHHQYPGGATLSKFDYPYDAGGNIVTWRQQADSEAVEWTYGYDAADQPTSAVQRSTAAPAPVLTRYAYDAAGNRTVEQDRRRGDRRELRRAEPAAQSAAPRTRWCSAEPNYPDASTSRNRPKLLNEPHEPRFGPRIVAHSRVTIVKDP